MPPAGNNDELLWSPVAGRPLLAWALSALRAAPMVGPVALVVSQSRLGDVARLIAAEGHADTYALTLAPGAPLTTALDVARADLASHPSLGETGLSATPRRAGSGHLGRVQQAPGESEDEAARVIILHDAARPLVTAEQIEAIVTAAAETGVAVGAEQVKETIKRVVGDRVVETLPREESALLIPPLAVRTDLLPGLLAAPRHTPLSHIAELVAAALGRGIAVRTVALPGPSLLVTSPADLAVAAALLGRAAGSIPG